MDYVIRAVRSEDWASARELRLVALQDPAEPLAFLETYEDAVVRPDGFWQQRADDAAEGKSVRQFVAERAGREGPGGEQPGGSLVGAVTVLVERADEDVRFGSAAQFDQAHLVGVFVRPHDRGRGVADELFLRAVDWSWSLAEPRIERVRLYVHEDNLRAAAFYRRMGFLPSGQTMPVEGNPLARELEFEIWRDTVSARVGRR